MQESDAFVFFLHYQLLHQVRHEQAILVCLSDILKNSQFRFLIQAKTFYAKTMVAL